VRTRREVARRVFAKEFNSSRYKLGGNAEKEPVYVLTPLGLKCNRIFIIGALIEKEETKPDSEVLRIRIADPTGSFLGFVGKFDPEAKVSLTEIDIPSTVAVTAKARLLERGGRVIPFIRPETINLSDFESRDYWILETAKATMKRIEMMKGDSELARLAREKYNPNLEEYKEMVVSALMRLKEEVEISEEREESIEESIEEEILDLNDLF
jgi:RPA family protein